MAVRELLNVAIFFYEALQIARKGDDNNEPSLSYGFGGQVHIRTPQLIKMVNLIKFFNFKGG